MNTTKTEEINATPAMRRFNRALEEADQLSGYRFDRVSVGTLVTWLRAWDHKLAADELESAARAIKRED